MAATVNANPKLYALTEPLSMDDAREATTKVARQRAEAREQFEQAITDAAEAERQYRKALAVAFVTATGDTAAQKEANARKGAADDAYNRDLKAGLVKVAQERLNEIDAVRASLHRLIEWSRAIDPMAGRQPSEFQRAA